MSNPAFIYTIEVYHMLCVYMIHVIKRLMEAVEFQIIRAVGDILINFGNCETIEICRCTKKI